MTPDAPLLWTWWVGSAAVWVGLSLLVRRRATLPVRAAPWIILTVAAGARLIAALTLPPMLSDDLWRYLHDGQTLAHGDNPYAQSPLIVMDGAQTAGEADSAAWLHRINNPELVTIYQPTSQYAFAAFTWLHETLTRRPCVPRFHGDATYRLAFATCDLLIVVLLLRQLRRLGRSPWWAVIYAWNPLAISETAWSGHQEPLGIVLLVLALQLGQGAWRSWAATLGAGVALGLAAGVKPVVLPVALPLAWAMRRQPGRVAAAGGACLATLALLYGPFLIMDGGMTGMWETSRYFVATWRFNGTLHPLAERLAGSKTAADGLAAAALVGVLVAAMLLHRVPWRAATTYFFALICLSSTAHPWYLLWALALLPVAWAAGRTVVGPAVWVASLTLAWSYAAWLNLAAGGEYQLAAGELTAVWVPIYAALAAGAWVLWTGTLRRRRRVRRRIARSLEQPPAPPPPTPPPNLTEQK